MSRRVHEVLAQEIKIRVSMKISNMTPEDLKNFQNALPLLDLDNKLMNNIDTPNEIRISNVDREKPNLG